MKLRTGWILIGICIVFLAMTGCASRIDQQSDGKINIVCTVFPVYDWVMQITKGQEDIFNVTLLMDKGADLHNYQPTAQDIIAICESDVFIYIGGESDDWLYDVFASIPEERLSGMERIALMSILDETLLEEEEVGEAGEEHSHGHGHNHGHDSKPGHNQEEEPEYDEHVWLSLQNARTCVNYISDTLIAKYRGMIGVEELEGNTLEYLKAMDGVEEAFMEALTTVPEHTIIVADRFPFLYLVKDYGIDYCAAFVGCSAETEASFETIIELADHFNRLPNTDVILTTESSDGRLAVMVGEASDKEQYRVLRLNSMQSVTGRNIEEGIHYLDLMEQNFDVMLQALGNTH